MVDPASKDRIVQQLFQWGTGQEDLRAILWTSSRTNPSALVDVFSDYDIILVVEDINPYYEDESWLEDFGRVLVLYRDPLRLESGCQCFARITQYEDGLKIDFGVWPIELLRKIAADPVLPDFLDVGYCVILDKDGLAAGLRQPSYRAFIPSPPAGTFFQETIEEFFHEATYVVKHLWRDDLIAAKYNLDFMMKYDLLRRMMEWQMEFDHGWSVKLGAYGRGLKKWIRSEIWVEFENTFTGANIADNWIALFRTVDLFRKVALDVATHLGYEYLHDLDRRTVTYLHSVEHLDRQAEVFPENFNRRNSNE
jgi:aminoglycoside 6-adenylyltransferase